MGQTTETIMEPPRIGDETPPDHNGIPYNNKLIGSDRKEKHLLPVNIRHLRQHEAQVKQQDNYTFCTSNILCDNSSVVDMEHFTFLILLCVPPCQ